MMFTKRFAELSEVVANGMLSSDNAPLDQDQALQLFHTFLLEVKKREGIVFVVGNGGSAGIASHFAIDLLNVLQVRAQTLYDSNALTCIANDYGYDQVFARPLNLLARREDLLVCISSSGNSQNILNAAAVAKEKELPVITLTGFEPQNPLCSMGNLNFYLPATDYGLVEMGHLFFLHSIIDSWSFNKTTTQKIAPVSHAE